jgi:IS5 family transposase
MTEQRTFADAIRSNKRRTTRREQFRTEMDPVIPWATVEALVEPHSPKAERGRRPLPMATMRRIYLLQQWFNPSDPQAEDMLYDSESMRRFACIELLHDTVPDETGECQDSCRMKFGSSGFVVGSLSRRAARDPARRSESRSPS